ncbi:MAG: threonine/tyrosine-specific protein kinase [Planctomycetota bacterium]|nr:MAG: threonine/tyrosine-specific protein kinase [Planctomycetota bacterium]
MGVVYVAKQQSLGREVVFKTLKPMPDAQASKLKASGTYGSVIKHRADMFLSEAVVTADLFHPNIVPIYELAEAPDGSMFYTMKWVRGDGWHKRIKEMTLEENLDVLMKVSDAMAFAHSRNIVNRDLKPENVMLGGYGETIVLDWGLALPFGEGKGRLPLATTAGLGSGTPAYMPPELITGPLNKIGPACDIYLLGAMLFEAVTGLPPHDFTGSQSKTQSAGAKMAEIRRVVVENVIRDTEHSGELIDIAKKAMATKAEDRYPTVVEFQNAIREYQKHAASRTLVERAKEFTKTTTPVTTEMKPASDAPTVGYSSYQNALALYQESLREWPGNQLAREGLTETQLHFAKLALTKGDFDLGLSVLDTNADSHTETRTQLLKAREEREGRVRVMKILKIAAGVMAGAVFLLLLVAAKFQLDLGAAQKSLLAANEAKDQAERDKADAEKAQEAADRATAQAQKDLVAAELAQKAAEAAEKAAKEKEIAALKKEEEAVEKLGVAEDKTKKAVVALDAATKEKKAAEDAKIAAEAAALAAKDAEKKATEAKEKASYLQGLAVANRFVQEGRYPDARKKLEELKDKKYDKYRKQEWDQLWNTVNAPQAVSLSKPVESIGISRDGRKLAARWQAERTTAAPLGTRLATTCRRDVAGWKLGRGGGRQREDSCVEARRGSAPCRIERARRRGQHSDVFRGRPPAGFRQRRSHGETVVDRRRSCARQSEGDVLGAVRRLVARRQSAGRRHVFNRRLQRCGLRLGGRNSRRRTGTDRAAHVPSPPRRKGQTGSRRGHDRVDRRWQVRRQQWPRRGTASLASRSASQQRREEVTEGQCRVDQTGTAFEPRRTSPFGRLLVRQFANAGGRRRWNDHDLGSPRNRRAAELHPLEGGVVRPRRPSSPSHSAAAIHRRDRLRQLRPKRACLELEDVPRITRLARRLHEGQVGCRRADRARAAQARSRTICVSRERSRRSDVRCRVGQARFERRPTRIPTGNSWWTGAAKCRSSHPTASQSVERPRGRQKACKRKCHKVGADRFRSHRLGPFGRLQSRWFARAVGVSRSNGACVEQRDRPTGQDVDRASGGLRRQRPRRRA